MSELKEGKQTLILEEPGNLSSEQWQSIATAFYNHPFAGIFETLKQASNKPQRAINLFVGFNDSVWNQSGVDTINNIFRNRKLPYRLTRIGTWASEGDRSNRLLAVVPWPPKKQEPTPDKAV